MKSNISSFHHYYYPLIVLFLFIFSTSLFSQNNDNSKMFSSFRFGFLAGANFSSLAGASVIAEGKFNLSKDTNLRLSAGYSVISKKESYTVRTHAYMGNIGGVNIDEYWSESYHLDKIVYDAFPVSLGFDYTFIHSRFSPYGIIEAGYNFFTYHTEASYGMEGFYAAKTLQGLPAEYQGTAPVISEGKSNAVRYAVGLGTNYKLTQNVNLDIRYVYQVNKLLENNNQILLGINF